jgi:ankyrin repeat protein
MDARRITITAAHARTCGWFPSHPGYEAWLDPARLKHHHGFLWISGKPGAGKSTMMKFAYSIMKNKASHNQSVVASFFFNARGDYLEKSISGMYRSLLLQLLEGYPSLQTVLDDLDLVPQNHNGCPSLNVLKELFYNAVSALGQSPFTCFIDALDECDEQQVVDMVQYFEDLTEQSTTDGIPFRICFSSRHYPYIGLQRGIRLTLENQLGHTEDLATYVASRLRIDDPALVEELRPQILGKAAGVFMWVVLVVDILNKEYRRGGLGLRRRLAEIPSDLSELFNDILRRDDENMEELLLCIMWILFATRPLQPRELYYALWSGLSLKDLADGQIPPVTVPDTSDGLNIFNRCVISSSKGIAEVTTSNQPTVQFIHESVRDFLIKDGGLHKLWPELGFDWEGRSHEILKQCCNMYMNHYLIHVTTSTVLSEPEYNVRSEISEKYPFLKYAGRHILYHANAAAKVVPQANFLRYFAMSNWISINNLFERSKDREYDPCVSLFYVLAERGFSDLIRTSFKAGGPLVGEGYHGPFFAAFANGHKDTIAALFNLPSVMYDGVDITEGLESIELSDYEHRSPLSWASQTGRTGIVKLLLQAGAPVNEIDEGGRTSLSLASEKGHDEVALLLIENGAKLEAKTKDRLTPLLLAIQGGHVALSRLLIEKGAKVHARDRKHRTALFFASEKGHLATAKLLVERVDLESSDSHGFTPLAIATREGHEEVASLLMHNGADVNASDENRQSPLMVAALAGYKSIAELLINNGADVNASDSYGQTPLTIAVSGGFEPMARLLIDNGADINTGDRKSRTPLILASAKGDVEMVRLLLEKGADLDTRDVGGWTPLEVATEQDHRAVVRLLISQGA